MRKYTYKKYMGDDIYSWAVFEDGRVVVTGISRTEAKHTKERLEREQKTKSNKQIEWGPDGVPFNN